jgi:hypothetical protein
MLYIHRLAVLPLLATSTFLLYSSARALRVTVKIRLLAQTHVLRCQRSTGGGLWAYASSSSDVLGYA